MRLKQLTNLNTLLLLTVCLALGITLWWSQRAMERPFQLLDQYLELSQRFDEQVARNVRQYLGSGDAVRQQAALQALESLAEALPELPPDLARTLAPSLAELREFSAGDLLAAGKLAGDPQGLLLQAERDLAGNLEQWSAYLDAATEQPQAGAYRTPLLLASLHLTRLSLARAKLVESANPALAGDVERELANLREQAGRIEALPLLGVLDEQRSASDDFAAMMGLAGDAEAGAGNAEDRGVALRRELASLLQRYPDELRRTRDLIERRQQLSADTGAKLDAVRQALATLEPQVRGERQRLQGQVRLIQGGMIALILLIALAIDSLQRRLARVLGQLVPALSAWADGDFSRPISLRTRTEDLRNLEDSLNRLRSFLAELVGAIHRRAEQVAGSSQTLAEVSSGLHAGVERQAGDTGQIRDALGDMEAAIQQVAGDASQTADASRSATDGDARADRADGSTCHRARAKLRRTGHEACGDAGAEDAERQQRERGQHHDHRVVDGRLVGMNLKLREQSRTNADDDGQHQDLDARRHHVAEHLFRKEARLVPECERDQDEAGERGQLELDQRDEKLYRQHEKAEDHHQPGKEQHHDGVEIHEHFGEARHVADLVEDRRSRVDAGLGQPARLQEVLHRDGRTGGGDAQTGE